MSCVYKGSVIDTDLSRNSKGGTEQMRDRLLKYVDKTLLEKVAIHFSRPRDLYNDVPNILYCHDLATDPENKILLNDGWSKFDHFVFVTAWQRDQYITLFGIPYSKCTVIQNSIELEYIAKDKGTEQIRFIYHTTPHRGLQLLYPIISKLSEQFNIHLDVYSSFQVYGWKERDKHFLELFDKIKSHPNMTYHGAKSNAEVLKALETSHIFLYPSIWQETSCIALIEAIKSGCVCIHPNYGALPETAAGNTIMYNYTENANDHANLAYTITQNILLTQQINKNFLSQLISSSDLPLNSIRVFATSWSKLLTNFS
jgi:UDP-glucose:(glucosyl)LPS alpha-1,2-glucosyltransferase